MGESRHVKRGSFETTAASSSTSSLINLHPDPSSHTVELRKSRIAAESAPGELSTTLRPCIRRGQALRPPTAALAVRLQFEPIRRLTACVERRPSRQGFRPAPRSVMCPACLCGANDRWPSCFPRIGSRFEARQHRPEHAARMPRDRTALGMMEERRGCCRRTSGAVVRPTEFSECLTPRTRSPIIGCRSPPIATFMPSRVCWRAPKACTTGRPRGSGCSTAPPACSAARRDMAEGRSPMPSPASCARWTTRRISSSAIPRRSSWRRGWPASPPTVSITFSSAIPARRRSTPP